MNSLQARIRSLALPNNCLHHDHDHHQLVIAARGKAEFEIAGRGGRVDTLHGCLVPSSEVHFYEGIGDNTHVVVDLPRHLVSPGMERLFDSPRYFEADPGLQLLVGYTQREAALINHYPEAACGVAQTLVATLYHRTFGQPDRVRPLTRMDISGLWTFIIEHLDEPLPVARLAGVVHVSVSHFHALFRDATGMTPSQFVTAARLEKARELLTGTGLPIADIALQVGFSSQSSLTHAFRRQFGDSPASYRRLH